MEIKGSLLETKLSFTDGHHNPDRSTKMLVENVHFWYGEKQALKSINLEIFDREVTAFIGPSGCGKTTLLRCLNRMNDVHIEGRMEGRILLDGVDIHSEEIDPPELRQRFGWVAQKPDPFPDTIHHNVIYGALIHGLVSTKAEQEETIERALRQAGLWDEVKDRLHEDGTDLSGGQQQRLCIARALAMSPEVILMDEPCSALDPTATARVEQLIDELRQHYTIVIITHNLQQAARVSQRTAFFHLGEMREVGDTLDIMTNPADPLCLAYVTGRYG